MRPLQSIAMGLLIVALRAEFQGYDALPDPIGWALVLHGLTRIPGDLIRRELLRTLAVLALVVSVPLWWPGVDQRLHDLHASLAWVANLPQLAFAVLLADSLARRAVAHGDVKAPGWLRTAMTGFIVAAAMPVIVFGAGVDFLEEPTYILATLTLLMLIWLLFTYAHRPWAGHPTHHATTAVDWTSE